jgi:hypothetical protein
LLQYKTGAYGLVVAFMAVVLGATGPARAEPSHGLADRIEILKKPRLIKQPASELSDLIVQLMPRQGAQPLSWDPDLQASVIWLSKTPRRLVGGDVVRQAIARIHLQGSAPVALRRFRREAGWTIRLVSDLGMGKGPRWIEITPGIPGRGCFGDFYKGCLFRPHQVFASAPLSPRLICKVGDASSFNQVYRVSSPGRQDRLVVYAYTNAADDEVSWIEIHDPADLNRFCGKANNQANYKQ